MLKKAVIDTNVWISALINPSGVPRQIANCVEADMFTMVCSAELIAELIRVLHRPKFANKITQTRRTDLLRLYEGKASLLTFKLFRPSVVIQRTTFFWHVLRCRSLISWLPAMPGTCSPLVSTAERKSLLLHTFLPS